MAKSKKSTTEKNEVVQKSKTLFDHVHQIRNVKNPKYFESLTEADKKSFNHYMLCRFLSMDASCITEVSYLSKLFDKMDSNSFYKVACALTNPVKYTPYIKSSGKKFNSELVEIVARKYEVSHSEAEDYCNVYMTIENGETELQELCRGYGLTDKEIQKLFKTND